MNHELSEITQLLLKRFNCDISVYDESYLQKSIESRIIGTCSENAVTYATLLEISDEEARLLLDLLTNSYSEFFRNPLTFALVEQSVIPKLVSDNTKNATGEVRIWSAGCAAGQEPYSLAMLANHFNSLHRTNNGFRIFATDNSQKQIDAALRGNYDATNLQNTRLGFVEKYFTKSGNCYSVVDGIKKQVDFSLYNLLQTDSSAPPQSVFGDFDLIWCSNVLFYYRPEIRKTILTKFYRSLKSGGFFITGEAEIAIVKSFTEFKHFAPPVAIFTKI